MINKSPGPDTTNSDGFTAPRAAFAEAQRRTLRRYGVDARSRLIDIPMIDGRAHVLTAGQGPAVMMAIGGGIVAGAWAPLMAEMGGFTLYAVDLPGHGLTDRHQYRTATLRADGSNFLRQVLDALELERVPFVAQSMGGHWTTSLALEHPDRVEAISFVGCPALILGTSAPLPLRLSILRPIHWLISRVDPPSPGQVARLMRMAGEDPTDLAELRELFLAFEQLPETPDTLLDLHRAAVRLTGPREEVELGADTLMALAQPTQIIWGKSDTFGSPRVGRQAADLIPDAEFHEVKGGHAPWFHNAGEIAALLRPFLARHRAPASSMAPDATKQ